MKYSILKTLRCPTTHHRNFLGTYSYVSMKELAENLITNSIWDKEITKDELPLVAMTTFNYNIRAECANPSHLFALDFDDAGNDIEKAVKFFEGYAFFLYTTSSHTDDHHKFRIMLKLDIDITNNIESHLVFYIIEERLKEVGLILDKQCKDISRRFYLPAYSKTGNVPVMEYDEGKDYNIADDLTIRLEQKIREDREREMKQALAQMKRNITSNKKKFSKDKKIEEAQNNFLSNPSHETLGKVIGSLRFWEMDDDEIYSWCVMNYNPSSGTVKEEVGNWLKWHQRQNRLTCSEKYK